MKLKMDVLLEELIERGVAIGLARAYKHTDTPTSDTVTTQIVMAIMSEIHEYFDFNYGTCADMH